MGFSHSFSHLCLQPPEGWFSGPTTPKTQLAVAWVVMLSLWLLFGFLPLFLELTAAEMERVSEMRWFYRVICYLFCLFFLLLYVPFLYLLLLIDGCLPKTNAEDKDYSSQWGLFVRVTFLLFGLPFLICIIVWGQQIETYTVVYSSSSIDYVRACAQKFPCPDGKTADALASIHPGAQCLYSFVL
jgi:hypothetical protein